MNIQMLRAQGAHILAGEVLQILTGQYQQVEVSVKVSSEVQVYVRVMGAASCTAWTKRPVEALMTHADAKAMAEQIKEEIAEKIKSSPLTVNG